jgi:hypothetical protein
VEQTEVDKLIGELEVAVDRLRGLYEQYFMGFEKLEPTVPRKDCDRKIHLLRKEQIRNTALRFRFQMIVQRYNTYQSHWQRICREIENGTYKRHVLRANRRFDNDRRSSIPPAGAARRSSIPPRPEAAAAAAGIPSPLPPPAPIGFPQPGAALPVDLAAELAELEREFGVPTGPLRAPAPLPAAAKPAAVGPAPAAKPLPPARPGGLAAPSGVASPKPPTPGVAPAPARPPVPPPLVSRAPVAPAAAGVPRPPLPQPMARVAAPPAPAASPAPPARLPSPATAPAPAQPRAVAPGPAPAKPAAGPDDLPDHRVRAIYEQFVDAKRRQKESTAAITYDAVAKSLRDSSAKLREKHGKSVDFEVTIRDGKAILKPVIK